MRINKSALASVEKMNQEVDSYFLEFSGVETLKDENAPRLKNCPVKG